jgi:hypothetical protein
LRPHSLRQTGRGKIAEETSNHKNKPIAMHYDFTLILKQGTEITEELADALFDAGCDDGTPGTCCGVPLIRFTREAESLESAIRGAVADVQKTGCVVQRVQIECDSLLLSSFTD